MQTWQKTLVGVGGLILLAGIFAYPLGLSASPGFSTGKAALMVGGLALIGTGALGRKTLDLYKTTAILLLNTLVMFVVLEMGLALAARLGDFLPRAPQPTQERDLRYVDEGREDLPYFQSQDWAQDYWREYHAAWDDRDLSYQPYVIWRNRFFEGKTLNIDMQGRRLTPGATCVPGAYRVFTFGGSTMWGTGVPDWGTIPAFLQAALSERMTQPVCVVNYAEQGWVSTQSVAQLALALRDGETPDVVIFYDGNNDAFAAYQSGAAGGPQNLDSLLARFEARPPVSPWLALASQTRTYRLLARVAGQPNDQPAPPFQAAGIDAGALADQIAQTYLGNLQVVQALADDYGFEAYFFWQTILLVDGKPLTAEEQSIKQVADNVYPGYAGLYRAASQRIAEASRTRPGLHAIMDVFADQTDLVFIDPFHVTVEGNQLIASEMFATIWGTGK